MYPWNDPDSGVNRHQDEPAASLPAPGELHADPADPAVSAAARAVQVALDRRDNGGDALPAATGPAATGPAATRNRQ
jgi:hypothetical protein